MRRKKIMRMISALPLDLIKGVMTESINGLSFKNIEGWPFSYPFPATDILLRLKQFDPHFFSPYPQGHALR